MKNEKLIRDAFEIAKEVKCDEVTGEYAFVTELMTEAEFSEKAEKAAKSVAEKYNVEAYGYGLDIRDEDRVKEIFSDV